MDHVIKMGEIILGLKTATVHGHSQFNKFVIFIYMSLTFIYQSNYDSLEILQSWDSKI